MNTSEDMNDTVMPAQLYESTEASHSLTGLGWGLFWRTLCMHAGAILLLAGIICFFAFNWEKLHAFAKFGLVMLGMLGATAGVLFNGIHSTAGRLFLLAIAILGGVLMAVYGQVYQTGANAWQLFRSWSIFLIPLAVLGRQTAICFVLWVVASLWGILYLGQYTEVMGDELMGNRLMLWQVLAQACVFAGWEALSHFFPGERFRLFEPRWFPRLMATTLLTFLTCVLFIIIVDEYNDFHFRGFYIALYCLLVAGGGVYYRTRKTDLFMVAAGLFSLIMLGLALIINGMRKLDVTTQFLFYAIFIIAAAALSAKFLIARYRRFKNSLKDEHEKADEPIHAQLQAQAGRWGLAVSTFYRSSVRKLTFEGSWPDQAQRHKTANKADADPMIVPWQARLLMTVCAWIAAPLLIVVVLSFFSFSKLEMTGYTVFFLIMLIAGLGMSRLESIFMEQTALWLALSGATAAAVTIAIDMHLERLIFMPAIVLYSVSYPFSKNNAYRFLSAMLALTLAFVQADYFFFGSFWKLTYHFEIEKIKQLSVMSVFIRSAFCVIFAGCSIALAHLWFKKTKAKRLVLQTQPMLAACFTAPFLIGLITLFARSTTIFSALFGNRPLEHSSLGMAGLGACAGLGWLVWEITKSIDLNRQARSVLILLGIPLAVASWYLPWLGIGFFMLGLARQARAYVLMGTSVLYLAFCTIVEYYSLSITLLAKSISMGGIGIVLMLMAYGLTAYLKKLSREQRLILPAGFNWSSENAGAGHVKASGLFASLGKSERIERMLAGLFVLIFFLLFSFSVQQKQRLLFEGQRIILELRPVDPRSLMQGDYMILNLDVDTKISSAIFAEQSERPGTGKKMIGRAIVAPDDSGVFHFVALDEGQQLKEGEARVIYRGKRQGIQVGSGSFFFQEGYGHIYETARYAEMRVSESGETLTTHLLDAHLERIDPEKILSLKTQALTDGS